MSIEAINAAWLADVRPASKKLVLLCLANMHNGQTGQLNPSVATVAKSCGISEKQARRQIHDLEVDGIVRVIGNHNGGSQYSTKRYSLNIGEVIHTPPTNVTPPVSVTPPADGSPPLPPMGGHPSHRCPLPLPPVGAKPEGTGIEPEGNRNREARKRATPIDCPQDIDKQVWADWLTLRKAKRAPVTQTVVDSARKEAAIANMTFEAFLREWCERGSQGLKAEWLQPKQQGGQLNKQLALEQRNRAAVSRALGSSHDFSNKVYEGGYL
jgi:hypothetical protein